MRRLLALLLVPLLAGCASSAPSAPPAASTRSAAPVAATAEAVKTAGLDQILPVDPAVTTGRLPNGLRYFIRRNARPEKRADIWLAVNAGSVLEDEDQRGLAHLVEHMAFNGTRGFERQELVRYLESIGMRFGADVNAYTDFDETVYTLAVPTDRPEYIAQSLRILEDWARGITFDPEEVARERGVVIEEWRLGRGAQARMQDKQIPILFQGSRYAERLPIGDPRILEKASPEALRRFYEDWYRPDLMAVVAVGDFDPKQVEAMIRERFSGLENPDKPRPRQLFPVPGHEEPLFAVATDPEATETTVALYWKHPRRRQDRFGDYRQSIVEALYHAMLNNRLAEIARRPDPPFLWAASSSGALVRSAELTTMAAGVQEGKVESGLAALLTEVERVRRHGFTAGELERTKKDYLLFYERLFSEYGKLESTSFAEEFVRAFLEDEPVPGIPIELELVRRFLPEIGLDEVNRQAGAWLTDHNQVVVLNGPERPGVPPLPSKEALLATFQRVQGVEVEPYEDRVAAGPLVPQPPQPGTLASERWIQEVGVTEWRLSNGVRVLLKPTRFRNEEVLITGYSPGGHSLVPDAEFPSALFAASLVAEGGLGELDLVTLSKSLAGRSASVEPHISQLEEGIDGAAATRDLETALQLVYLTVTAPRQDEQAARSFLAKMRAVAETRLASPEEVFSDRLNEVLTRQHPRWRPVTPELIDRIDPATAFRIYRDRFADAGDFTFILVGSFEPAAVRPLVLTWLGGLPSTGRRESWRDVGRELPEGVQRVEVTKGLEPKAQVQIAFSGPAEFGRESRYEISSLADLLEIRLREALREDRGAVYGVEIDGDLTRRPRERYSMTIGFSCAPEQADELVQAVLAEIEKIQRDGVPESYVGQVQESQRRDREVSMKTNRFWITALEVYDTEGLDPRDIVRYEELIAGLSPERLRDAARKYLNRERYVLGILRPEGEGAANRAPAPTPGR